MYKIDKTDSAIIDLLMEDGRMPCAEIARRMGNVSERSVRYRIEKMSAEGVIKVRVISNPKAVGLDIVADVWMEVDSDAIADVANKLAEFDCISYVACSIGEKDVSAQVIARDASEVYRFVTTVIAKIPGVRKTTTSIVPIILKDVYQWRFPIDFDVPKSNRTY